MIGCMAKAKSDSLRMDDMEMEDVRWISKADVKKALERSSAADNPLTGDTQFCRLAQHQCLRRPQAYLGGLHLHCALSYLWRLRSLPREFVSAQCTARAAATSGWAAGTWQQILTLSWILSL